MANFFLNKKKKLKNWIIGVCIIIGYLNIWIGVQHQDKGIYVIGLTNVLLCGVVIAAKYFRKKIT